MVLNQNTATTESIIAAIRRVYEDRAQYTKVMCEDTRSDGTETILDLIRKAARHA